MKNTRKIRKQKVKVIVSSVSPCDLNGSSQHIYDYLQYLESFYRKNCDTDTIEDMNWGWEGSNDDPGQFVLTVTRLENDKEYNARVKRLMKIKDQEKYIMEKEAKAEYEEYLRLKKKFEKQN